MLSKTPGQPALIYQHSTSFLGCQPALLQPFRPRKDSLVFREARQSGRRIHLAVDPSPSQWPFVVITLFRTSPLASDARNEPFPWPRRVASSSSSPKRQLTRTLLFSLIEIGDSHRQHWTVTLRLLTKISRGLGPWDFDPGLLYLSSSRVGSLEMVYMNISLGRPS